MVYSNIEIEMVKILKLIVLIDPSENKLLNAKKISLKTAKVTN
jgi:hypothetical protein